MLESVAMPGEGRAGGANGRGGLPHTSTQVSCFKGGAEGKVFAVANGTLAIFFWRRCGLEPVALQ